MIQRIQTIHLICATLICLVSAAIWLVHPFPLNVDGNAGYMHYIGAFFLFASACVSLWSIFVYKNRPRQMRIVMFGNIVLVVGYVFIVVCSATGTIWQPWSCVEFYLPVLSIFFNLMAHKRIRYDENLVRSADRLR